MQEVINKNWQAETYNYDRGDLIVLINLKAEESYDQLCTGLKQDVNIIIEYIKRYLGVDVSASLGGIFCGVNQIKCAVNESLQALSARFLSGGGAMYTCNRTDINNNDVFALPDYLRPAQLEEMLWNGNFEKIQEYLKSSLNFAEPQGRKTRRRFELRYWNCITVFENTH